MHFLDKFPQKVTVTIIFFILISLSSCVKPAIEGGGESSVVGAVNPFPTFRDVPGITAEEIAALEELQRTQTSFSYGSGLTTETFLKENSEVGGFTSHFCTYLSSLFGIPFIPEVGVFGVVVTRLTNGDLDFSGALGVTPERLLIFNMSDPIAERQLKIMRIWGSPPMEQVIKERLPRYAINRTSIARSVVPSVLQSGTYEIIEVATNDEGYLLIQNGRADAYIETSTVVDGYPALDVYTELFFPLYFTPVSLSTANPAFKPIISVINKALENGARDYINYLYSLGFEDYKINRFRSQLTPEETSYLRRTTPVPLAAQYFNYPVSFYNNFDNEWQGIAFDILAEVTKFTGLEFTVSNKTDTELFSLLDMVYASDAYLIPDLAYSPELESRFLWSQNDFLSNQYALLSKTDFPNIILTNITNARVGLIANTSPAEMFRQWFPNASNTVEYSTDASAFVALDSGEVDFIMASQNRLLSALNYYELPNYKVNYFFNHSETSFAFNKDQETLRSIIDKIIPLIDTDTITKQWMSKTYDYRRNVAEGRIRWVYGAVFLSLAVLTLIIVLFVRSRVERKRLVQKQEELVIKQAEVEAANRAKSAFLANMSHEIRTPMNAILGITEIILRNETLPSDVTEALYKIYNSGDLLLYIINDILDLSKIEAGKLEIQPARYEAASMINDTVALNMMRIGSKPIEFSLHADENLPAFLLGDELRIRQILNNILSNAIKYTQRGEIKLTVFAEKGTEGLIPNEDTITIVYTVSDTGQGMTQDQVGRLFEEYSRFNMDANRTTEGTGLGMTITRNLVKMMNGKISVESEPDKGTTVTVHLPQGDVGSGPIGKELAENLTNLERSAIKQIKKAQINFEPMPYGSVLVVDDVESNLFVAEGLMVPYGLAIDSVLSGFDAIEKIKSKSYDIIFMDHMMPKMDGIETTKKIRGMGYTEPIIALTANAIVGQSNIFMENGFDGFISKPIDIRQLNATLKKFVRDKQPPEVIEAALKNQGSHANRKVYNRDQLALIFMRDASRLAKDIEEIQKNGTYGDEEIRSYTINTHALKSALTNIGETELSAIAAKLETAGRAKDIDLLVAETPAFLKALWAIIAKHSPQQVSAPADETIIEDLPYLKEKLEVIKTACEVYDRKTIKAALTDLQEKEWTSKTRQLLATLEEYLLNGDFAAVAKATENEEWEVRLNS